MTYTHIIPRDLFNDANLLKCLGNIYIQGECAARDSPAGQLRVEGDGAPYFDIRQDAGSGATFVSNVVVSYKGHRLHLTRPINSREPWPLYWEREEEEGDEVEVFNDDGTFAAAFLCALRELSQ